MEEMLAQYGIAGVVLIGASFGCKAVWNYMKTTITKNNEQWKETFRTIVDENKAREVQLSESSKEREDKIIEALNSQGETLKSINTTITEFGVMQKVLQELNKKEVS